MIIMPKMAVRINRLVTCRACLGPIRQSETRRVAPYNSQSEAYKPPVAPKLSDDGYQEEEKKVSSEEPSEKGAMTRRLEQATEEVLLTGGRAGKRAIEDAGFSEELKEQLFNKAQEAKFRKNYSSAFATFGISSAVGEGTRHIAVAQPWAGKEDTEDTVLRMLDDVRKPLDTKLRGKFRTPLVDMRIKRDLVLSPSQRIANARDKAYVYAGMSMGGENHNKGLTDEEREEMRQVLRERFQPGHRCMPDSIAGLAALANERIEDAIARGQFKDITRGKGIGRDTRADNPFIDTTEYILNKMLQRQEIVPPWIEKQQDLVKTAHTFRTRLRNDWKRHASRMIASKGGSLLEQMNRAEQYAKSERVHNSQHRHSEQVMVSACYKNNPAMVKMHQQLEEKDRASTEAPGPILETATRPQEPFPPPFRDPDWEKGENAYMQLSIDNLNSITRLYNLMAPDLAKKPYFSLERELANCFAESAPQLAHEIKERAKRPSSPDLGAVPRVDKKDGFLDYFDKGDITQKIHESKEKAYGLKEWWKDIWGKN